MYLPGNKFMSDDFLKGGRGKRAPYTTTHYRVPVACKESVETVCKVWKEIYVSDEGEEKSQKFLQKIIDTASGVYQAEFFGESESNEKVVTNYEHEEIPGNNFDLETVKNKLHNALSIKGNKSSAIKAIIEEVLEMID
jgi:hypothetical protein